MKPKPIGGHKTQTYLVGPTTILSRAGQNSFTIATKEGDPRDVHIAQLKPYFDDVLKGGVPKYSTNQITGKKPQKHHWYRKSSHTGQNSMVNYGSRLGGVAPMPGIIHGVA